MSLGQLDGKWLVLSIPMLFCIFLTRLSFITSDVYKDVLLESLTSSLHTDRAHSTANVQRNVGSLQGRFAVWKKFVRDQNSLDNGETVGERQNRNAALGFGLAAQMEQDDYLADGDLGDPSLSKVLKSADATLSEAGLKRSGKDSSSLYGNLNGNQLRKEMEILGSDSNDKYVSLKKALESSRRDLRRVLNGLTVNRHQSVGLGDLAVNSMTEGFKSGLQVYRRNPITGAAKGSLTAVDSTFVDRLGKQEMRSVAAGRLPVQATLIGLGDSSYE